MSEIFRRHLKKYAEIQPQELVVISLTGNVMERLVFHRLTLILLRGPC